MSEALTDPAALRVWLAEHADVDLPGRYEFYGSTMAAQPGAEDDVVVLTVPHPVARAMITDTVTGTIRKLRMFIVASRERRPGLWPYAGHSVSNPAEGTCRRTRP